MFNFFFGNGGVVQYAVVMVIMAGIASLGFFLGKTFRQKKDLKKQSGAEE